MELSLENVVEVIIESVIEYYNETIDTTGFNIIENIIGIVIENGFLTVNFSNKLLLSNILLRLLLLIQLKLLV